MPGWSHVEREPRDALVLRDVDIGPSHQHAEVGEVATRRPHLLAVHDEHVAVPHGGGAHAGEVRPCLGLAEQLAPGFLTVTIGRR